MDRKELERGDDDTEQLEVVPDPQLRKSLELVAKRIVDNLRERERFGPEEEAIVADELLTMSLLAGLADLDEE